jgi:Ca2+-binding RTX toxin-like protein
MDDNNDKVIDQQDKAYDELLLWQDKNSNGFSEPEELRSLKEAGIKSISLVTKPDDRVIEGNSISETSSFTFIDGRIGEVADVHYHNDDMDTWYKGEHDQINIEHNKFKEEITRLKSFLLKELDNKIRNPESVNSNDDNDWVATLIKAKTEDFISDYKQHQEQELNQLLGDTNAKLKLKSGERAIYCQNKTESFEGEANQLLVNKIKNAEDELLEEVRVKFKHDSDNIHSRHMQEYNAESATLLANINARLKQANDDAYNAFNRPGAIASQVVYNYAIAANKARLTQERDVEQKALLERHQQLSQQEIKEAQEKYQKEFDERNKEVTDKLQKDEVSSFTEKSHAQEQECNDEKVGLKKLLQEEYATKAQQNANEVKELEQEAKQEATKIYKYFVQNILLARKDHSAKLPTTLPELIVDYNKFVDESQSKTTQAQHIATTGVKIDPETLFLPLMRGYGNIPALHIAMTENPNLKLLVSELSGLKPSEFHSLQTRIMAILYEWAGVSSIDESARAAAGGTNIEARKVAFVEQVTGQEFKQLGAAKFVGQHASTAVQKAWDIALIRTTKNLLIQGPLFPIFPKAEYSFLDDTIKLNSNFEDILTAAKNFAEDNSLGYDFWAQLGYIVVLSMIELGVSIDEIRARLSQLAGEPVMINVGTFELIGDDLDNIIKGTSVSDYIKGLGGNDKLYGRDGSDYLEGDDGDDELYGELGIDRMHGGAGNDKMYGGEDRDFMYGNEGNDEIFGQEGDDHIEGGAGADNMDGGAGENTLSYGDSQIGVRVNLATGEASGGDGDGDKFKNFQNLGGSDFDDYLIGDDQDNHINGESGNDEIHGGKGDDQLFGATGEDRLYGEEGDDYLTGFVGPDHMDGGEGIDTANYHHPYATVGVKVDLIEGTGIGGYAHGDTYKNIENVQGSKFNDVIRGDNQNNILYGMEGDDTIYGEEGDDIIIGGSGNNKLFGEGGDDKVILGGGSNFAVGGEGDDTISYQLSQVGVKINMSTGTASVTIIHEDIFEGFENAMGTEVSDEIVGDDKDNKLFGLGGDDIIHGGKGDDTILPGAGDDTVYSEEGNDYIFGDDGNDAIDGGDGKDTVDYSKEPKEAIIIDLKKNIIKGGFAKGDKLKNIENIIGTKFDDQLTGDDNDNILSGLDGDDVIHGGLGDDILVGGSGRNQLYGDEGDDKFVIGKGENMVYGGEGYNEVSYEDSASEVTIDLTQKQGAKSTGEIDKFEDIVHADGSDYNDRIIGDDNENHLNGGDGDDYIDGGSSNDVISGGNGINTLIGGKGSDVFLALEGTNSIDGGEGIDTINYSAYLKKFYQEIVTQARLIKAGGALTSLPFDTRFITKPVISYAEAPVIGKEGLVIDLSARQIIKPGSFIDTLSSIENVVGTHYNDVITGTDDNNELNGLDGDDIIRGREGNDTLVFGYGKSALYGDGGDDQFMFRDSSNDYRSIVIAGIADIYGGEGNDKLNLRSYPLAVQVNIGAEQISYSTQGSYMLQSIEHVITTDFNDEIRDSNGDDYIESGNGDDTIYLTIGNDAVNAGEGNDIIYLSGTGEKRIFGGESSDVYVVSQDFKSVKSTIIVDFKTGIDRIDLTNFKGIKGLSDIKLT